MNYISAMDDGTYMRDWARFWADLDHVVSIAPDEFAAELANRGFAKHKEAPKKEMCLNCGGVGRVPSGSARYGYGEEMCKRCWGGGWIDGNKRDAEREKAPPAVKPAEPCNGSYVDFQGAVRNCTSTEGCCYARCPAASALV